MARGICFIEQIKVALLGPVANYNKTRRELKPHNSIGSKDNGLFHNGGPLEEFFERRLGDIAELTTESEVNQGPQVQYSPEKKFHLNIPHRQLGFSWAVFKCFKFVKKTRSSSGGLPRKMH